MDKKKKEEAAFKLSNSVPNWPTYTKCSRINENALIDLFVRVFPIARQRRKKKKGNEAGEYGARPCPIAHATFVS